MERRKERSGILQLSGRYGSHEAAQPYRKWRTQGKEKDKQGQWHEVGEVKGVKGENQRGRSKWSSGSLC